MKIVLVVSLLVAGTLASTVPESSGYGSPGYGNAGYGGVGYFLDSDVTAATEFANSVRNELHYLNKRLEVFLEEEKATLNTFDNVIQNVIPHLTEVQLEQDHRLENIKQGLLVYNINVRRLLSQLAGEEAIANQINTGLSDLSNRIALLVRTNRNQNASLISIETELFAAKEMLLDSLTVMESTAEDQIHQLVSDVEATIGLINTRHCFTTVVHVDVDEQTAAGEGEVDIPIDLFDGGIPLPLCVLQGFHTKLNLGKSYSYGAYGSQHDRRRNVALTVNCYAIGDSVAVKVFDQSRGNINRVTSAYVAVKTCSFGPQAVSS